RARAGGSGPGPRLERRRTSRRVSGGSGVASPRCHLSPFPACGGGVGWGAGGQPGSFRLLRHLAPIPAFPRKRGKGKSRPRLSAMISLPRERGRVGGGGRRTPSTPLAAWTLRAHVTPVPHRG